MAPSKRMSQQKATRLVVPFAVGTPAFPSLSVYSNTHTHCQSTHAHTRMHAYTHTCTSSAQGAPLRYWKWVHHRGNRGTIIKVRACTRQEVGLGTGQGGMGKVQGMWKSCKGTWTPHTLKFTCGHCVSSQSWR